MSETEDLPCYEDNCNHQDCQPSRPISTVPESPKESCSVAELNNESLFSNMATNKSHRKGNWFT